MPILHSFIARGDGSGTTLTPTMVNLLIALVVLFATIAILVGTLLIFRQMRRKQKEQEAAQAEAALPMYTEKDNTTSHSEHASSSSSRGSRLIITTPSYAGFSEKEALMRSAASTPASPDVPEIRITFPEEVDESGKRTSGRVVVVKVGEHSVGLEPVHQDQLPPYRQREDSTRFESLDLERMGGLKEKEMR